MYISIFNKIQKTFEFAKKQKEAQKCTSCLYLLRSPESKFSLLLLHCCEAFGAVYRSVVAGLEGNLSFLTALSANSGKEFSFLTFAGCVLSLVAACLASLGFVLEALFCVEFLFTGGEYEFVATFLALSGLVLVHCLFLAFKNWLKNFCPRRTLTVTFDNNALELSYSGVFILNPCGV